MTLRLTALALTLYLYQKGEALIQDRSAISARTLTLLRRQEGGGAEDIGGPSSPFYVYIYGPLYLPPLPLM